MTTVDLVRACYSAYATNDLEAITALHAPDVVYHVAGKHPLSGDKVGREAVLSYMIEVATISGFRGGFQVDAVAADGQFGFAKVTGTAFHGDTEFTRPVMHLVRFEDGLVQEFWDLPFDQYAEDAFWSAATP